MSQVEPLSPSTLEQKPCENAVKSLQSVIQVHGKNGARSIQEEFRGLKLCVYLLGINLQRVHNSDKYSKDVAARGIKEVRVWGINLIKPHMRIRRAGNAHVSPLNYSHLNIL